MYLTLIFLYVLICHSGWWDARLLRNIAVILNIFSRVQISGLIVWVTFKWKEKAEGDASYSDTWLSIPRTLYETSSVSFQVIQIVGCMISCKNASVVEELLCALCHRGASLFVVTEKWCTVAWAGVYVFAVVIQEQRGELRWIKSEVSELKKGLTFGLWILKKQCLRVHGFKMGTFSLSIDLLSISGARVDQAMVKHFVFSPALMVNITLDVN